MSSSKTVRFLTVARAAKGGATRFDASPSVFNAKMKYLSASIFGDFKVPVKKPNVRLVNSLMRRPLNDRDEIVRYYPAHEETAELMDKLRDYGLFRDEHKDFAEEMERLRKLRGKSKEDWSKKWIKKKK